MAFFFFVPYRWTSVQREYYVVPTMVATFKKIKNVLIFFLEDFVSPYTASVLILYDNVYNYVLIYDTRDNLLYNMILIVAVL